MPRKYQPEPIVKNKNLLSFDMILKTKYVLKKPNHESLCMHQTQAHLPPVCNNVHVQTAILIEMYCIWVTS